MNALVLGYTLKSGEKKYVLGVIISYRSIYIIFSNLRYNDQTLIAGSWLCLFFPFTTF